MYKVSGNLNSAYGPEPGSKAHNKPDMPQVTTSNRRMTNVKLSNGEYVQGIRRNDDVDDQRASKDFSKDLQTPGGKPLRYTPGLVCDAHLESLRPERNSKHAAFSGPEHEQWRKKLIQSPKTFDESFADADMQNFRPEPAPPSGQDEPWFASRVPDGPQFPANERLMGGVMDPYGQPVYPQDELSRIKLRNRRFQQQGCGAQAMGMPPPPQMYYGYGPSVQAVYPPMPPMGYMMPPQVQQPPVMMMPQPQPQQLQQSPLDDLQMLDQELNMTRQVTRPFVPTNAPEFNSLQRQRDILEQPLMPEPRQKPLNAAELCPLSIDDLPKPKKTAATKAAPTTSTPATSAPSSKPLASASSPPLAIKAIALENNPFNSRCTIYEFSKEIAFQSLKNVKSLYSSTLA